MAVSRLVKLRLAKDELKQLDRTLFQLEGVWNWALRTIEIELVWYRIEAPVIAQRQWLAAGASADKTFRAFTPKMEVWLQQRLFQRINGHAKCELPIAVMRQTIQAVIRAYLKARADGISINISLRQDGGKADSNKAVPKAPKVWRKGLRNPLTWLGADSVKIDIAQKALYFPGMTIKGSAAKSRNRRHTGLRFFKHSTWPEGKIAGTVRISRKPRGWYAALVFPEATIKLPPLAPDAVDILGGDLGFKSVLACSDKTKYARHKSEDRLWRQLPKANRGESHHPNHQATRGGGRQRAIDRKKRQSGPGARINQRLKNAKEWRNRLIVRDLQTKTERLVLLEDNLPRLQKLFGKSILKNAHGDLVKRAKQVSSNGTAGRSWTVSMVPGAYSTISCPACGARTGPSGFGQLSIREWTCSACGKTHDRDTAASENAVVWCLNPKLQPNTKLLRPRRPSNALRGQKRVPRSAE